MGARHNLFVVTFVVVFFVFFFHQRKKRFTKNGIYSYIHRCFTPLTTWTPIDMFIIHICFDEAFFSLMKKKKQQQQQQKQPHRFRVLKRNGKTLIFSSENVRKMRE